MRNKFIENLNAPTAEERLDTLKKLVDYEKKRGITPVLRRNDANNHIHTIYSFSPYSPAKAAYTAYGAGLETMGIMDHDSLSGAKEFIEACRLLGTNSTVGMEVRAHLKSRRFGRINNPDQNDHMYVAVHGVPHQNIDSLNEYMSHYRKRRNLRNMQMVERINERFGEYGITIDFDRDVYPLSMAKEGGSITERHLLYALSRAIYAKLGGGEKVTAFLKRQLGLNVSPKIEQYLQNDANPFKLYDLLGVLKSDTSFFYLPAGAESPDAEDFADVVKSMGAVVAYPYLGDVGDSVTGDKKAQTFEDSYLDALFEAIKEMRFDAVAYMPTRNTREQLARVRELCKKHGFFEISGEDINSPRQKFECALLADPMYSNLIESTWALIGHEKLASKNLYEGMFTPHTAKRFPDLTKRIQVYAEIGRKF